MLDTKTNTLLKVNKNENINKMDELYILQDNNIFKLKQFIKETYKELIELREWKENHKCNNNINIKENPEYIEITNLNNSYNNKIEKLEFDIKNIQLNSNIEDNVIFKQIKEQNTLLFQSNNKLKLENEKIHQKLNIIENDNKEDISNIKIEEDSDGIDFKTNEALEKQKEELNIKYSNKIDSLTKINNKKKETTPKCGNDKYSEEFIYNSIYIYEDVKLPYQKYRASKTYRKLLEEIEFNNKIGDNTYDDITNWINNNEKTNFKSSYFKNKYNRSKLIIEKYKDNLYKLNNLKFSISYISTMSENKFNDWLNILEDKFNNYYKNNIDEPKITIPDGYIKCIKCNSYIEICISDKLCYYCGSKDEYWE